MNYRTQGFTLIEVMVVVVILGILASIIVPNIISRPDDAKVVKARQDILTLESALELYKLDNGFYPSTDQGLQALVREPSGEPVPRYWREGGYIKKLSQDPWDRDYIYLFPGDRGEYDLYSLGADGREGGEKFDADIGNWTEDAP